MKTSEEIDKISAAIVAAQAEIGHALKDAKNPHFKSEYATLESVIDTVKPALTKNKLGVIQAPVMIEGNVTALVTRFIHESGQFYEICSPLISIKNTMQDLGSAITYQRRYSLASFLGVAQSDDDGNAASAPAQQKQNFSPAPASEAHAPANHAPAGPGRLSDAQIKRLHAIMKAANSKGGSWTPVVLNKVLSEGYKVQDPYLLHRKEYDELCTSIEGGATAQQILNVKSGKNPGPADAEPIPF